MTEFLYFHFDWFQRVKDKEFESNSQLAEH